MPVGSVNYSSPVTVHGYSCKNCTEVDLANKGIDPEHPGSGPFDRDAATDPSRKSTDPVRVAATKRAAEHAAQKLVGYSSAGGQTASVVPGAALSITV